MEKLVDDKNVHPPQVWKRWHAPPDRRTGGTL